jgi:hypothetical protein
MTVTSYGADSLGTRYVQLHRAVRETDGGDYPSSPKGAVAGIPVPERGMLVWRYYRASTSPNYRGEIDPPRELSASVAEPNYADLHLVDAYDAKQIGTSLTAVERRLSEQRETYGSTADFAEHAMRIMACFKAVHLAIDWKLYTEATGVRMRDHHRGQTWRWLELSSARSFFADLARIDTTERCRVCRRPIDRAGLEGSDECHDCRRERERREGKGSETVPAPVEPREEDGVPVH